MRALLKKPLLLGVIFILLLVPLGLSFFIHAKPKASISSPSHPTIEQSHMTTPKETSSSTQDVKDNDSRLSQQDNTVKDALLTKILHSDDQSGVVYASHTVQIEYISDANVFQAEILTSQIEEAKKEAVRWFRSHGISQQGICNLPINFYLNLDVKEQLQNTDSFNPLPDGC